MAETELKHLAAIPYQIVSPASNTPIIGIFQDSMLGSYQFTRENVKFSLKDAMNLLFMFPHINVEQLRDKGNSISNFDRNNYFDWLRCIDRSNPGGLYNILNK